MTEAINPRKLLAVLAALLLVLAGLASWSTPASAQVGPNQPGSCSDGVDNDGDGDLDGADDDCREDGANENDNDDDDERANCSDGVDNDKDGRIDYPADTGCKGPNDGSERSENQQPPVEGEKPNCSDGIDNDKDGRIDHPADTGCKGPNDGSEDSENDDQDDDGGVARCSDGLDNDKDGQTDYPADPGCKGPRDGSEDSEGDETQNDTPECRDGIDNDGDGEIDYSRTDGGKADAGCVNPDDDTENSDAVLTIEKQVSDAQRPASYSFTFTVDCPGAAHDQTVTTSMTPTVPSDSAQPQTATGTATIEELHDDAICTVTESDPGAGWSTTANGRPGRTTEVQLDGDTPTRAVFVNTRGGTTPPGPGPETQELCGEGDPREPLGVSQTLYDALLNALLADPERSGPLSSALADGLAPLDPVGVEVACIVSLIDGLA